MKKSKVSSTLYYIVSVMFSICAMMNFVNGDTSMGVTWMAIGSTFLCLGSIFGRKADEGDDDSKNNKED